MKKSIENEIEVKIHRGDSIKEMVDAFYRKYGSQIQARHDDLFFLAFKNYLEENNLPSFLQLRLAEYRSKALETATGKTFSCMKHA